VVPAFYLLLAADRHGGKPSDEPRLAAPGPTVQA
jgi:multidrug efflux pump